jgi:cell division protein FtsZ
MTEGGIYRLGGPSEERDRPKMMVVGCGGAGCNTLARAADNGLQLGTHVATNTDAQHLLTARAHRKILLGRMTTYGRGANSDIGLGERACEEARGTLEEVIEDTDIIVVLAGLGGGTGSGAAPVVADVARRSGAITLSLATLPFTIEGSTRRSNAEVGRAMLARRSDVSVVIPNDRLLEASPTIGLLEAFRIADEAMLEPVRMLHGMVTREDLVALRRVLKGAGAAHLGRGSTNSRRGWAAALEDAVAGTYPPAPPAACTRALVLFRAPPAAPSERELYELVRSLHLTMAPGAETAWGVHRDESLDDELQTIVLLAVRAPKP